jgi:hypothetical protein
LQTIGTSERKEGSCTTDESCSIAGDNTEFAGHGSQPFWHSSSLLLFQCLSKDVRSDAGAKVTIGKRIIILHQNYGQCPIKKTTDKVNSIRRISLVI